MQGIIDDAPLRKKPNKEPSPYEDKNKAKDRNEYLNNYLCILLILKISLRTWEKIFTSKCRFYARNGRRWF